MSNVKYWRDGIADNDCWGEGVERGDAWARHDEGLVPGYNEQGEQDGEHTASHHLALWHAWDDSSPDPRK